VKKKFSKGVMLHEIKIKEKNLYIVERLKQMALQSTH
jgi:hypothetical protein